MSVKVVRSSPYRHVFGTAAKPDKHYTEIKASAAGDGHFIDANAKFFAVPIVGNGGPVAVVNNDKPGRYGVQVHKVAVHKAKVLDVAWNRLNYTVLATGAEDCHIGITQVPEGGLTDNIHKANATLSGSQKKVTNLRWHPTASNILASGAADSVVRVWDVTNQAQALEFSGGSGGVHDIFWNNSGSQIAAATKDKKIRLFDPRASEQVTEFDGPTGVRKVSVRYGNDNTMLVSGHSSASQRQLHLFDERKLDSAADTFTIDSSSGNLLMHYDADNSIAYLAGKGDSSIKYFEVTGGKLYKLQAFSATTGHKGLCFLPKLGLDAGHCEIAKALRVTGKSVEPVSFVVPRKSDLFQKDIFPDTYAGVAAMTADEYLAGKNAEPALASMEPGKASVAAAEKVEIGMSPAEMKAEIERLKALLDANSISY